MSTFLAPPEPKVAALPRGESSTSNTHKKHVQKEKVRKAKKRTDARRATVEDVLFVFEKVLEGWRTIKIYNVLLQSHPESKVIKSDVEDIATGNCKVVASETTPELFAKYEDLRAKVYQYHAPTPPSL